MKIPRTSRLLGAYIGLLLCLISAPVFAQPEPIRDFVTRLYIHGVPYEEARAYGPEAIPELEAMLRDESLEAYWRNVVGVLGYVGDPAAVNILKNFLSELNGEISDDAFGAALVAAQAFGHLAAQDNEALQLLYALADERVPERMALDFTRGRYRDAALREVMGRVAIMGLGISGRAEALAYLEGKEGNVRASWDDNIAEAIALNNQVRTRGAAEVFGNAQ